MKNNEISSKIFFEVEPNIFMLSLINNSESNITFEHPIEESYIQFHFCFTGKVSFSFNEGRYSLNVSEESNLLLYNPLQKLPLHLILKPYSSSVSIFISLKKLHELFKASTHYINFLKEDNKNKKYYTKESTSASMAVILSQLLHHKLHSSVKNIYTKGKIYELLALYFNKPEATSSEQCPFLVDEDNLRKIKMVKDIVTQKYTNPPSLKNLSDEVGLSLKKLKEGFKEVYGDTVYAFILNYKMEHAIKLLQKGEKNINEIGLALGYSTASHFISAFKKKYGTTPKKYLKSII